ncbi:MAG TPA: YdcF family protein [Candidatus Limnocylindria bacterium]|nr:YdcF family protein [Candidatus Limnocylindria bacterium]
MSGTDRDTVAGYPEVIVVLGGGMQPDGTPARATSARGSTAAELARLHPRAAIICSGSHGVGRKPRRSEAASMADLIVSAGIDRERIFLEDESRDTIGNAVHVADRYLGAIPPRAVYIVTSPFHLERSVETFRLVLGPSWRIEGVPSAPAPDDADRAKHEGRFLQQTREFLAGMSPGEVSRMSAKLRERR